jgi:Family of unknown function (DUF6445)
VRTLALIRLNPDAVVRRQEIGDGQCCVIVDNFLEDPQALVEFAHRNRARARMAPQGYPGTVLALGDGDLVDVHRFIRGRMSKTFGFLRGNARLSTSLTMTTLRPAALSNFQRLCHTDPRETPARRRYAALVYLFRDETLGGTAFYRWKRPDVVYRALALELHDTAAAGAYLAQHCHVFREPPCYMTRSNELAEQLAVIPPRFNRMLFYSGEIAHSGHITAPQRLSGDFRRGRLTLNCFASVEPLPAGDATPG